MIRECLKIIGTAHVSQNSADEVRAAILEDQPDVVAIELDRGRYQRLMNERNGIVEDDSIHITKIIKENKVGVFLVTTILSYMQNKIGEDVDIKPGSEMIAAVEASEELNIEELKEQSNIDQAMEYFKEISPGAYTALVKERDAYLAKGILGIPEDKVIAVVGAGHREGIIDYLDNPETLPSYRELNDMDKKGGIPWLKIILALIPISFSI